MRIGALVRTWLPAAVLVIGWTAGWVLAWQFQLLEGYYAEAAPGVTVFTDEQGDQRILWAAAGVGLFLGSVGLFFLVHSSVFRADSDGWSRVWLVSGGVCVVLGLSLPILYPSATSLVIDEQRGVIAVERQWLYTATADVLPIDELARVNLRVQRRQIGTTAPACQIATGLSLVRHDRTWMEIPSGYDHETVAASIAEITGAPFQETGTREC